MLGFFLYQFQTRTIRSVSVFTSGSSRTRTCRSFSLELPLERVGWRNRSAPVRLPTSVPPCNFHCTRPAAPFEEPFLHLGQSGPAERRQCAPKGLWHVLQRVGDSCQHFRFGVIDGRFQASDSIQAELFRSLVVFSWLTPLPRMRGSYKGLGGGWRVLQLRPVGRLPAPLGFRILKLRSVPGARLHVPVCPQVTPRVCVDLGQCIFRALAFPSPVGQFLLSLCMVRPFASRPPDHAERCSAKGTSSGGAGLGCGRPWIRPPRERLRRLPFRSRLVLPVLPFQLELAAAFRIASRSGTCCAHEDSTYRISHALAAFTRRNS